MEISDGEHIDLEKVKLLSHIVSKSEAKIILHSGWRFWFDENLKPLRKEAEYLESVLEGQGLRIAGFTPDLTTEEIRKTKKFSKVKAEEILAWINAHGDVESWVVLEDLDLHNEEVQKHQVKTDPEIGLTEDDVTKAVKLLNVG